MELRHKVWACPHLAPHKIYGRYQPDPRGAVDGAATRWNGDGMGMGWWHHPPRPSIGGKWEQRVSSKQQMTKAVAPAKRKRELIPREAKSCRGQRQSPAASGTLGKKRMPKLYSLGLFVKN